MLRKFLLLSITLVFAGVAAGSAVAAPYVSGNLGLVFVNDSDLDGPGVFSSAEVDFDPGFGFLAAVGNDYGGFRVEGEVGYRTNDLDSISGPRIRAHLGGDVSATSLLANIFVDIPTRTTVTPFLGAGIGLAEVEVDSSTLGDDDDTVFAWQVGAGLAFAVDPNLKLDVSYRLFATEDPDFDSIEAEYLTNSVFVGARVSF